MKNLMEKTQSKQSLSSRNKYWFKARRYGWGWTPSLWQGWFVILVFVFLEIILLPKTDIFVLGTAVLVGILLLICIRKGEKPRWRWGGKK